VAYRRGAGAVGCNQRDGAEGFGFPLARGEYNGSDADHAVGEYDGSHADHALVKEQPVLN